MSELVVVGFDKTDDADRVLTELNKLRREYLIDLADAVVAVRDTDGKVQIKQSISCLLYTSPSPRDKRQSRMPSSA